MRKKVIAVFAAVIMITSALLSLAACRKDSAPINGVIEFHDIMAVIPGDYARDASQSSRDQWVFEKGGYKECIVLSRKDASSDPKTEMDGYADALREFGAEAERGTYFGGEGVISRYTKDGVYCQEVSFACSGSVYAFALRGGSEEEFRNLMGDIITPDGA